MERRPEGQLYGLEQTSLSCQSDAHDVLISGCDSFFFKPALPYALDAPEKCWGERSEDSVLAN